MIAAELVRAYRKRRRPMTFARASLYAFLALVAASWGFILLDGDSGLGSLFSGKTWNNAGNFVSELLGIGPADTPAILEPGRWLETGKLAYNTLAMSVLAISIAGIGSLLTMLPAARNISSGELGGSPSPAGQALHYLLRVVFTLTRGVPELVWAMIIVFFLSPGVLLGAIALGIHNYGIVGRLTAEVVENLDPAPARALRAAGASNFQMFLYGILPRALPQFTTYLLYRWEVVIRTTVVVGFVSAGGLGREFRLSLSFFHFDDVFLIILWYLILVIGVDLLSAGLRRRFRLE